jgi:alkylated DNA repair protein (DNA oxidative demethylase)
MVAHLGQDQRVQLASRKQTGMAWTDDLPQGFSLFRGALAPASQRALLTDIQNVMLSAPLFQPSMPRTGKPFSVKMTNCGPLGWVSDKERGYRYQPAHPETALPWPPMPDQLLELWRTYATASGFPEACLINIYPAGARMGSHRDMDEKEPGAPVLSVSLGDDAVFHVGGLERSDPKVRVVLRSGDVCLLGGPSRFAYHGIDRILPGTSTLVPGGGRINLTLRRVTAFSRAEAQAAPEERLPSSARPRSRQSG